MPKFRGETLAGGSQTVKFVKVFFPLKVSRYTV
jgi:hypothetical protein